MLGKEKKKKKLLCELEKMGDLTQNRLEKYMHLKNYNPDSLGQLLPGDFWTQYLWRGGVICIAQARVLK